MRERELKCRYLKQKKIINYAANFGLSSTYLLTYFRLNLSCVKYQQLFCHHTWQGQSQNPHCQTCKLFVSLQCSSRQQNMPRSSCRAGGMSQRKEVSVQIIVWKLIARTPYQAFHRMWCSTSSYSRALLEKVNILGTNQLINQVTIHAEKIC